MSSLETDLIQTAGRGRNRLGYLDIRSHFAVFTCYLTRLYKRSYNVQSQAWSAVTAEGSHGDSATDEGQPKKAGSPKFREVV